MKCDYMRNVNDRLTDIIYDHVCYAYPEVDKVQVERVLSLCGYDINRSLVIYIQNLKTAWTYMLEQAAKDTEETPLTRDLLCIFNRICMGNISRGAGDITKDYIKIPSTNSEFKMYNPDAGFIFGPLYDYEVKDFRVKAVQFYCRMMRMNLFKNGNEETARLMANYYLLRAGVAYFNIPEESTTYVQSKINAMRGVNPGKKLTDYLLDRAIK